MPLTRGLLSALSLALAIQAAAGTAWGHDATSGGVTAASPTVTLARCADGRAWACRAGSSLVVEGEQLKPARSVVFLGGRGRADDRPARPRRTATHSLVVRVPARAATGPLVVMSARGRSRATRSLRLAAPQRQTSPSSEPAVPLRRLFAGSRTPAVFRYRATGASPAEGAVEVVRVADGDVVDSQPIQVGADGVGEARWNGMDGGLPARVGRYRFRIASTAPMSVEPAAGSDAEFAVYDHIFPIRGRHDLGQSATNNFGGGRGHQGQDMFAACGTRLAAVAAARVKYAGYHPAAGNYLVLERSDGRSYAYMHMRDPALVRTGDRVYTGQRVGVVGDSGRASGCHLHFELWTAPGWYDGGHAVDPLPYLRQWDRWS